MPEREKHRLFATDSIDQRPVLFGNTERDTDANVVIYMKLEWKSRYVSMLCVIDAMNVAESKMNKQTKKIYIYNKTATKTTTKTAVQTSHWAVLMNEARGKRDHYIMRMSA